MNSYVVFRNEKTGEMEAVKNGFSFAASALTAVQLGWVWAFAKGAKDFGWKLLAVTAVGFLIFYSLPYLMVLWLPFAASIGRIANGDVSSALRKRGYTELG